MTARHPLFALLLPLALLAVVLGLPPLLPAFYVTLFSYIGLAALVAVGLTLLTGIAGQTSFGQGAFVGIAAYTTAVLTKQYGFSPWFGLVFALLASGAVAWLLGLVTVRLSGHYLPVATIAWAISITNLFGTLPGLGGYNGMAEIPRLTWLGRPIRSEPVVLGFIWLLVLLVVLLTRNLLDSRQGRAARALNGGRLMAESMGVNTAQVGLGVFVIGALYAALAGWLYAHVQGFVNPTPFGLNQGLEYLFMVIVGGAGWLWGAVLGAAAVMGLRDQLNDLLPRLLGRPGNFEGMVFAALVILVLQFAPQGIWPALRQAVLRFLPARLSPPGAAALATRLPPVAHAKAAQGGKLLEISGATRRFGGLVAADAISFDIAAGEIVALIGPNGAGKSTLFNLITGVLAPDAGSIRLLGARIDGLGARAIARQGVARSFQHVRLLAGRSVRENVALGAHLRGRAGLLRAMLRLDRAEEARILAEAAHQIAQVGLGQWADRPAGDLSLGQQRIVEIARALCMDPAILLLDEPAAGLRLAEKRALAGLLRQLRAAGTAVLLVEHDMDFVMGLVDRVVVMNFGRKIAEGSPMEMQQNQAVRDAYLGGIDD